MCDANHPVRRELEREVGSVSRPRPVITARESGRC
jgi:hypothetical protein